MHASHFHPKPKPVLQESTAVFRKEQQALSVFNTQIHGPITIVPHLDKRPLQKPSVILMIIVLDPVSTPNSC